MTRTTQRWSGALIATLLAILLSLSTISPALAAPDQRDDFALGRYVDSGDFGDWSSVLTQSLGILALHRASGMAPSDAAVDLLLAQQCDDGSFPDAFRAPSTSDPAPCSGGVDTTAFAVQALDAIGEDDAVAAATGWLVSAQDGDGSFGGEDGLNSTSTGLAALALAIGGHDAEAAQARDWVLALQDACDTDTPGAIPFRPGDSDDDRGVEVMSTSQALLGLAGPGLAYLDAGTASGADPVTGCDDDPSGDFGDAAEAAATYLLSELADGSHLVVQDFPSDGATIDVLFALAAVEQGGNTIDTIFAWLSDRAAGYTQGAGFDADDAAYAGATAKLALAAIVAGQDPRGVGGIDLIAQLEARETTELPEVTLSCEVEEAAPGDEVSCTIAGLLGGETVDVLVELDATLLDEAVTADSSGSAAFVFTVPEDATEEDEATITVAGLGVEALADLGVAIAATPVSDEPDETDDTEDVEETDPVDEATDDQDVLPETGDQLSLAAGMGVASLLFGLVLVAVSRRRREVEHA